MDKATNDIARTARKGEGFSVSTRNVPTRGKSVRILHAECVGTPIVGDRKVLKRKPLLVVAEFHGSRLYRIFGASNASDMYNALQEAEHIAYAMWRTMTGQASFIGLESCATPGKGGKRTASRKPRKRVPVKPANTGKEADAQRLHVRDITRNGQCNACGSGDRMAVCKGTERK